MTAVFSIYPMENLNMKSWARLAALAAALVLTAGNVPSVLAAERSVEPERCLHMSRIKSTEILSNKQIVFQMQGGDYFLNTLPYACPGLRRDSTLLYRTSLDLLPNVDVVTVLESLGSAGFLPGASCGLGIFEPMEKEEIAGLRKGAKGQ